MNDRQILDLVKGGFSIYDRLVEIAVVFGLSMTFSYRGHRIVDIVFTISYPLYAVRTLSPNLSCCGECLEFLDE